MTGQLAREFGDALPHQALLELLHCTTCIFGLADAQALGRDFDTDGEALGDAKRKRDEVFHWEHQ